MGPSSGKLSQLHTWFLFALHDCGPLPHPDWVLSSSWSLSYAAELGLTLALVKIWSRDVSSLVKPPLHWDDNDEKALSHNCEQYGLVSKKNI